MWHVVLPFPIGLVASRLFYGRIKKAGRQGESFSPTVASILTTPLLAFAYHILLGVHYAGLAMLVIGLVLYAPTIVPLLPLLVIYLRGGFQRKRIFGLIVAVISVVVVILQFAALFVLGLAFADR
jgi:accessory gene regulator protein AgrB